MVRMLWLCAMMVLLAGCRLDAEIELFAGDLLSRDDRSATVPVRLTVYGLGFSDEETCAKVARFERVLARFFETARFDECRTLATSLEDAAIFEVEVPVVDLDAGRSRLAGWTAAIVIRPEEEGRTARVWLVLDEKRIAALRGRMQMNFMDAVDAEDLTLAVELLNDLRRPVLVEISHAFLNGRPVVLQREPLELARRRRLHIRLADVVTAAAWAGDPVPLVTLRVPADVAVPRRDGDDRPEDSHPVNDHAGDLDL